MATRLYNQRQSTFTAFTPTPQGTWGDTSLYVVYPMNVTATAVHDAGGYLTRTVTTAATAVTLCHAIFVSPPLSAGGTITAADDVTINYRCIEAGTTQNVFQQFYWGIYSNTGTLKGISALDKGATEYATTLISRTRTDVDSGLSISFVPGDRLFVEWGWDKDGAVAGDVSIQYGYSNTAGDLLGDGDTGVQNSWVEWAANFTFDPEGTVYGVNNSLMMTGFGR
jgi:hypothetical protein